MPIWFGNHEFINVGEIELGSVDVQEVYFGSTLIWPLGGGGSAEGGYILIQDDCRLLTEETTEIEFMLIQAGQPLPSNPNPIIASVLDRMCQLTAQEETAVIDLVTCLIDNGLWDKIHNMWGLSLNPHDNTTAWKDDDIGRDPTQTGPLVQSPVPPSYIASEPAMEFFDSSRYFRTTNTVDQMFTKNISGFFVYINASPP